MVALDLKIIDAIKLLGQNAYGVTIRQYLEIHELINCDYDTLYLSLDHLEQSGIVYFIEKEGDEIRSFRPRRFYKLTASGKQLSNW